MQYYTKEQYDSLTKNIPKRLSESYQLISTQIYDYLISCSISKNTIDILVNKGLIYQDKYSTINFINKERTWGERQVINTDANARGIIANSRKDGFWWFTVCESKTDIVYICEWAIDAISLFELNLINNKHENAVYVSIGGSTEQLAIDRLKKQRRVIMAVNNDSAGSQCRKCNRELECIIPKSKDWNDDLKTKRAFMLSI